MISYLQRISMRQSSEVKPKMGVLTKERMQTQRSHVSQFLKKKIFYFKRKLKLAFYSIEINWIDFMNAADK